MVKIVLIALLVAAMSLSIAAIASTDDSGVLLVKIQKTTNEDTRDFHFNKEVTSAMLAVYQSVDDLDKKRSYDGDGVPEHLQLARDLFSVEGVTRVMFSRRYEISITKGKAFDWKKVESDVLATLQNHFKASKLVLQQLPTSPGSSVGFSAPKAKKSADLFPRSLQKQ